jgi:ankyrin repeat protein
MRTTLLATIGIFLACLPAAASAQIYKCQLPDASTIYQDRVCSPGTSGTKMDSRPPVSQAEHAPSARPQVSSQVFIAKNNHAGDSGSLALARAIIANNKTLVNSLLDQKADVNYVDPWFKTALDYAAAKPGWSDIVQKLIEQGASCGVKRNGSYPIDTAADFESIKLIKACVLRQTGAPPRLNDTIYHAVEHGNQALVLSLQAIGADINGRSNLNGEPPIIAALGAKSPEDMISFVLDHGADINATSASGRTLLKILNSTNKPANDKLISMILKRGARENAAATALPNGEIHDNGPSIEERIKSCDPAVAVKALEEELNSSKNLKDPLELFGPALGLFERGEKDRAVFWYYAAYLRVRYQLPFENGDRGQLLTVMRMTAGPPIINYASRNTANFRLILSKVLEWDKKTPNPFRERARTDAINKQIDALYADFDQLSEKLKEDSANIEKTARSVSPGVDLGHTGEHKASCK